jgi:glycosyltransferase involved in cell wall biosynthesis
MRQSLKNSYWQFATRARMFRQRQLPAWLSFASIVVDSRLKAGSPRDDYAKSLLLLAWEFPPQVTGGVYRPASFAKYAAAAGWKTVVLTGPLPESVSPAGRYLEQSIPESVSVHRAPAAAKGPHPWPLPDIDGGVLNAVSVYEAACKLDDMARPGIIVASGPPFHNFVAGMWLAKRFGWRLVLDYRDEWTQGLQGIARNDSANRLWEGKCLRSADRVVFTTESQLAHQMKVFPALREDKCVVVYNGWEPADFMSADLQTVGMQRPANGTINIAFFGNLGPWCRPAAFLDTLAKVFAVASDFRDHVKIHFVGNKSQLAISEISQFPYQTALKLVSHVNKTEVCRMMKSADALLLINPPSMSRYIPGKTYEYVASGTPILLFGEGGEMANIVKHLNAGMVVAENDAEGLKRALHIIRSHQGTASAERTEWLKTRTREISAQRMLAVLDDLRMPSQKQTGDIRYC